MNTDSLYEILPKITYEWNEDDVCKFLNFLEIQKYSDQFSNSPKKKLFDTILSYHKFCFYRNINNTNFRITSYKWKVTHKFKREFHEIKFRNYQRKGSTCSILM